MGKTSSRFFARLLHDEHRVYNGEFLQQYIMVRPTSDMDGNVVNIVCLVLLPEEGSLVKLYSYRALTTAKVKFTTKRSSTLPVFVYHNFHLEQYVGKENMNSTACCH